MSLTKVSQMAGLLAKDNSVALLSTVGADGGPRSRYMGAYRIRPTGEIFLISPSNAHKIQDIRVNPRVQVIFTSKDLQRVLTLSGRASVVDDMAVRHVLYEETKPLKIYPVFDDHFGVIHFVPLLAEYLDLKMSNDPVVLHAAVPVERKVP